jgi:hypothetical protein
MRLHGRALGFSVAVGIVAAAGCSSSDSTPGGSTDGGGNDASGGSSSGGGSSSSSGGSSGSSSGGPATGDGGPDARASDGGDARAPVCGPFADGGSSPGDAGAPSSMMSFFVTSDTSMTGNLGGLAGADTRCKNLAMAVGLGAKNWHAYLSVEHDAANGNGPTNARDRIGAGPWYNFNGAMVAADLTALHVRTGDPAVFVDEHGAMINGQWTGSRTPLQHDILTGSLADGTVALGKTCLDWTSAAAPPDGGAPDGGALLVARVGHTDGFGPACSMATTPINVTSWNSAHDNAGCNDTTPRGGAGRIYCFATN